MEEFALCAFLLVFCVSMGLVQMAQDWLEKRKAKYWLGMYTFQAMKDED